MERRTFLRTTGLALSGAAATGTAAGDGETNPTPVDGSEPYQPKIRTLRAPLAGVPAIEEAGDALRVELDAEAGVDPATVTARLVPSFGAVTTPTELDRETATEGATSEVWNATEGEADAVTAVEFRIPGLRPHEGFTPGLYDLEVSWDGGGDRQPRAVSVRERIPDEPEVAVVADPQLGDPRAGRSGFQEAQREQSPEPFVTRTSRMAGTPTERWGATRRAIAEVNALDPDLVLVAGDLTLGQDAPGKYYLEYEDAWSILNELRVPSFCTLGNHDGIVQGGVDGKRLYRETFGPPSYSVDVGDLHLVVADTFDWTYLDRLGGSAAVSTYGGQVRDAQLEWLRRDLAAYRERNPDGTVLAMGHHNPSWIPDPENRVREETDGRPVLEQVGRGSRYAESGQLWTGENQFALRETLDAFDVAAYVCGHSHRDRLARTVGDGVADVIETPGPRSGGDRYNRVRYERTGPSESDPDGEYSEYDWTVEDAPAEAALSTLSDTGAGTLYVNCTTTQSSTGQYWGFRPLTVDTESEGIDPTDFGYPWTEAELDERAVSPGAWSADLAASGLYSHPSYRLAVQQREVDARETVVEVTNDLATPVAGATLVTLPNYPGVRVENGEAVWRRRGDGRQTVKVAFEAAAEATTRIVVEGRPRR
ncbi:metallophosphoesterase family protein [Halorarius halobius]|uniref:metallophosphoesterase family protein n=1 Tax=Halorarius halobius TaxID=2962671 RepID=UPI0020CBC29F|nr:metallophosphoesterase [Halorarius halobius]